MRIAQIAPLTESVPPRLYGGTERVVSFLTEQLVAMGHDVNFCSRAAIHAPAPNSPRSGRPHCGSMRVCGMRSRRTC